MKLVAIIIGSYAAFIAALFIADYWNGSAGVLLAYVTGVLSRWLIERQDRLADPPKRAAHGGNAVSGGND